MTWILGTFTAVAVITFLYTVHTFFRLDRVSEETVKRYWSIQAMDCVEQESQPVFVFHEEKNADLDFALRFSRTLYDHLSKKSSDTVRVNRKLIGYLPEWDYGLVVVKSVAGRRVLDGWRIPSDQQTECAFRPDETIKKATLTTKIQLR